MKNWLKKYRIGLLMTIPGIVGGLLYWKYIGCTSGTCALKSNWEYMSVFGGLTGFLLGDWIQDLKNKKVKDKKPQN